MKKDHVLSLGRPSHLLDRVRELRNELAQRNPLELAVNTATVYQPLAEGRGQFCFSYWQKETALSYPAFLATSVPDQNELGIAHQALILYYFLTARPRPLVEKWISFAELPDGRFYNRAFQGYTGRLLGRHFSNQLNRMEEAVRACGGSPYPFANQAYLFWVLPRVPLLLVYWEGDEDFPANYQILFDASIDSYLPTDACAIAGSMLTRKLIAASVG
ncbi:MAG: DUF3786 domain-containing protein [Anaerolineales bacterium]|nr:DUF3786 domain-containing protein [Anaerolineales bacterium]MDW8447546.1 DUF3786 domain-containing protein [Anaerolineales bacterium]